MWLRNVQLTCSEPDQPALPRLLLAPRRLRDHKDVVASVVSSDRQAVFVPTRR
jgi:hypothetical protein